MRRQVLAFSKYIDTAKLFTTKYIDTAKKNQNILTQHNNLQQETLIIFLMALSILYDNKGKQVIKEDSQGE